LQDDEQSIIVGVVAKTTIGLDFLVVVVGITRGGHHPKDDVIIILLSSYGWSYYFDKYKTTSQQLQPP
jgi:hypothetical protein